MTAGCGLAQHWGGPIQEIRPSDVIRFAPGEKALARRYGNHGHDAHRHLEQFEGKTADWMEKVSDEQYQA